MEELIRISGQANGDSTKHGPIYTSKEVMELGIPSDEPIPEPKTCKYCGKTLYHECIVIAGKALVWWLNQPQRCDCEKQSSSGSDGTLSKKNCGRHRLLQKNRNRSAGR